MDFAFSLSVMGCQGMYSIDIAIYWVLITQDQLNNRITQHLGEILDSTQDRYAIAAGDSQRNDEDVTLMTIHSEHNTCFLLAVAHIDVEDAMAVCAQAVLYNSTCNDSPLYYAVYEVPMQVVHFCLCDPHEETYELVSKHSMRSHASQIATYLSTYVFSNARVLR
jgi:hypothetical protein